MSKTYALAVAPWFNTISVMQQSVLLSAIRGPDGFRKHHPAKLLLKWYRRCILISAFDGHTLDNPYHPGGGSFTGPSLMVSEQIPDGTSETGSRFVFMIEGGSEIISESWVEAMKPAVDAFVHSRDEMTLHYFAHMMHAFEILGYKHPDPMIRAFWNGVHWRMANALHMLPETEEELDRRLGDNFEGWAKLADEAGSCSE